MTTNGMGMTRTQATVRAAGLIFTGLVLIPLATQAAAANDQLDLEAPRERGQGSERRADITARRAGAAEPSPVVVTPGSDLVWTGLPRLASHEGELCLARRWVQLPAGEVGDAERQAGWDITESLASTSRQQATVPQDDCPVDAAEELPPEMLQMLVHDQVVDVLPRPEPSVPPGYALTGMPAYLVTGHELAYGPDEHEVDLEIMQVDVEVTGQATSAVDWGDGSDIQTYDQPGLAHPDGGVSHTYAETGKVTIEIVDTWTLDYEVYRDGAHVISDTATFDLDPATLDDLEVEQLQAVRTTPN